MSPRPAAPAPPGPWLSVWPTGQTDLPGQLDGGGYLPGTAADTAMIPPAVAAHAVAAYSRPGRGVHDPDCGAGTVLVEALRAGRHAAGRTADPAFRDLARDNVTAVKAAGARGDGAVGDPAAAPGVVRAGVDLVLTALRPPGPHPAGATAADPAFLCDVLAGYARLPRPGGRLVVVTRPHVLHPDGPAGALPPDPAVAVVAAGRAAGLIPLERCVALLAALRGGRLVVQSDPAHLDVVVFRTARAAARAHRLRAPRPVGEAAQPGSPVPAAGWRCHAADGTRKLPGEAA
jgi:hypothetical protein